MIVKYVLSFGNYFHNNLHGGYIKKVKGSEIIASEFFGYVGKGSTSEERKEQAYDQFGSYIENTLSAISKKIDFKKIENVMDECDIEEIKLKPLYVEYIEDNIPYPLKDKWVFKVFVTIQREESNEILEG